MEPRSLRTFLTVFLALPLRVGQAQLEALPAVGLSSYDLGFFRVYDWVLGFRVLGSRVELVLSVSRTTRIPVRDPCALPLRFPTGACTSWEPSGTAQCLLCSMSLWAPGKLDLPDFDPLWVKLRVIMV